MPRYGQVIIIKRTGADGNHFPLTGPSCLFGRKIDCDIRIQLPHVSKEHCKLEVNENNEVILSNLSDVNPTSLNGKVILHSERLKHGDVFTIIDRSFRFEYPLDSGHFTDTRIKRNSSSLKNETLQVLHVQQGGEHGVQPAKNRHSISGQTSDSVCVDRVFNEPIKPTKAKSDNWEDEAPKKQQGWSSADIKDDRPADKEVSPFSHLYEMCKNQALHMHQKKTNQANIELATPKNTKTTEKLLVLPAEESTTNTFQGRKSSRTPLRSKSMGQAPVEESKLPKEDDSDKEVMKNLEASLVQDIPSKGLGKTAINKNTTQKRCNSVGLGGFTENLSSEKNSVLLESSNAGDVHDKAQNDHQINKDTPKSKRKSHLFTTRKSLDADEVLKEIHDGLESSMGKEQSIVEEGKLAENDNTSVHVAEKKISETPKRRGRPSLRFSQIKVTEMQTDQPQFETSEPITGVKSPAVAKGKGNSFSSPPLLNGKGEDGAPENMIEVESLKKMSRGSKNPHKFLTNEETEEVPFFGKQMNKSLVGGVEPDDSLTSNKLSPSLQGAVSGSSRKRRSENLEKKVYEPASKQKRVSFGVNLCPEVFDKHMPPNSPLRKGGTPRRFGTPFRVSANTALKHALNIGLQCCEELTEPCKRSSKLSSASPARSPTARSPALGRVSLGAKISSPGRKSLAAQSPSPERNSLVAKTPSPSRKSLVAKTPSLSRKSLAAKSPSPGRKSLAAQSPSPERKSLAAQGPSPERNSLVAKTPSPGKNSLAAKSRSLGRKSLAVKTPPPGRKSLGAKTPSPGRKSLGAKTPSPGRNSLGAKTPSLGRKSLTAKTPSPGRKSLGDKTPSPGRKSLVAKSPSPGRKSLGVKSPSPGRKSLTAKSLSPDRKSFTSPVIKKSRASGPFSIKVSATLSAKSPRSAKMPSLSDTKKSPANKLSSTKKSSPSAAKQLPRSASLGSFDRSSSVRGRFSVSRIKTPPILLIKSDSPQVLLASASSELKQHQQTTNKPSNFKKTPSRKSARRSSSLAAGLYSRRQSGASVANLLVKKSWAQVVKEGVAKSEFRSAPKKHGMMQRRIKKNLSSNIPKTPIRSMKDHYSTGHAASPATIIIGKAQATIVKTTGIPPRIVTNVSLRRKSLAMDQSFTGVAELFMTPMKKNQRASTRPCISNDVGSSQDITHTQVSQNSFEGSVIKTLEETGELVISPLTAPGRARRRTSTGLPMCRADLSSNPKELHAKQANIPKAVEEPTDDLASGCTLLTTPKEKTKPVVELNRPLKTPKVKGIPVVDIKEIMKTPKIKRGQVEDFAGQQKVMAELKQKAKSPEVNYVGVKEMFHTTKEIETADYSGLGEMFSSPKRTNEAVESELLQSSNRSGRKRATGSSFTFENAECEDGQRVDSKKSETKLINKMEQHEKEQSVTKAAPRRSGRNSFSTLGIKLTTMQDQDKNTMSPPFSNKECAQPSNQLETTHAFSKHDDVVELMDSGVSTQEGSDMLEKSQNISRVPIIGTPTKVFLQRKDELKQPEVKKDEKYVQILLENYEKNAKCSVVERFESKNVQTEVNKLTSPTQKLLKEKNEPENVQGSAVEALPLSHESIATDVGIVGYSEVNKLDSPTRRSLKVQNVIQNSQTTALKELSATIKNAIPDTKEPQGRHIKEVKLTTPKRRSLRNKNEYESDREVKVEELLAPKKTVTPDKKGSWDQQIEEISQLVSPSLKFREKSKFQILEDTEVEELLIPNKAITPNKKESQDGETEDINDLVPQTRKTLRGKDENLYTWKRGTQDAPVELTEFPVAVTRAQRGRPAKKAVNSPISLVLKESGKIEGENSDEISNTNDALIKQEKGKDNIFCEPEELSEKDKPDENVNEGVLTMNEYEKVTQDIQSDSNLPPKTKMPRGKAAQKEIENKGENLKEVKVQELLPSGQQTEEISQLISPSIKLRGKSKLPNLQDTEVKELLIPNKTDTPDKKASQAGQPEDIIDLMPQTRRTLRGKNANVVDLQEYYAATKSTSPRNDPHAGQIEEVNKSFMLESKLIMGGNEAQNPPEFEVVKSLVASALNTKDESEAQAPQVDELVDLTSRKKETHNVQVEVTDSPAAAKTSIRGKRNQVPQVKKTSNLTSRKRLQRGKNKIDNGEVSEVEKNQCVSFEMSIQGTETKHSPGPDIHKSNTTAKKSRGKNANVDKAKEKNMTSQGNMYTWKRGTQDAPVEDVQELFSSENELKDRQEDDCKVEVSSSQKQCTKEDSATSKSRSVRGKRTNKEPPNGELKPSPDLAKKSQKGRIQKVEEICLKRIVHWDPKLEPVCALESVQGASDVTEFSVAVTRARSRRPARKAVNSTISPVLKECGKTESVNGDGICNTNNAFVLIKQEKGKSEEKDHIFCEPELSENDKNAENVNEGVLAMDEHEKVTQCIQSDLNLPPNKKVPRERAVLKKVQNKGKNLKEMNLRKSQKNKPEENMSATAGKVLHMTAEEKEESPLPERRLTKGNGSVVMNKRGKRSKESPVETSGQTEPQVDLTAVDVELCAVTEELSTHAEIHKELGKSKKMKMLPSQGDDEIKVIQPRRNTRTAKSTMAIAKECVVEDDCAADPVVQIIEESFEVILNESVPAKKEKAEKTKSYNKRGKRKMEDAAIVLQEVNEGGLKDPISKDEELDIPVKTSRRGGRGTVKNNPVIAIKAENVNEGVLAMDEHEKVTQCIQSDLNLPPNKKVPRERAVLKKVQNKGKNLKEMNLRKSQKNKPEENMSATAGKVLHMTAEEKEESPLPERRLTKGNGSVVMNKRGKRSKESPVETSGQTEPQVDLTAVDVELCAVTEELSTHAEIHKELGKSKKMKMLPSQGDDEIKVIQPRRNTRTAKSVNITENERNVQNLANAAEIYKGTRRGNASKKAAIVPVVQVEEAEPIKRMGKKSKLEIQMSGYQNIQLKTSGAEDKCEDHQVDLSSDKVSKPAKRMTRANKARGVPDMVEESLQLAAETSLTSASQSSSKSNLKGKCAATETEDTVAFKKAKTKEAVVGKITTRTRKMKTAMSTKERSPEATKPQARRTRYTTRSQK